MAKAAGILFTTPAGTALFVKRAATAADYPGTWCFPGGHQEDGETAEETAIREAKEEIGAVPEGLRILHTRQILSSAVGVAAVGVGAPAVPPVPAGAPDCPIQAPGEVDFTTFVQNVEEEFAPVLNDEHDGWAWAPKESPPEPMHPGCRIALDRFGMNELGVARAIADGRLTSPQRYENMTMFAIRITGTDVAFRSKIGEFVYRRPENYLNEEFLARCNGLPVIFKHPPKSLLNSEEFSNRVVGTVFLPYLAGDEVWAVVKIFVDDVAQMMEAGNLSTSPGVNFKDFSVNAKLTMEDGSKVLFEGSPSLLDHIAVCELGVWDKGGEPSGIRSESRGDSAMTEDEKKKADAEMMAADKAKKDAEEKEEKERKDADAGSKLDKTLSHITDSLASMHKRMDTFEEKEKQREDAMCAADKSKKDGDDEDAERLAADKAKKDADEKEKEEKAKADSDLRTDLQKRIDAVAAMIPKAHGDADYHSLVDAQARADEVFCLFGQRAPIPQQGETPKLYERRVIRTLKEHSPTWKAVDPGSAAFADDAVFSAMREQVYADAAKAGNNPSNVTAGQLRMVTKTVGGHIHNTFLGEPRSWMDGFAGQVQLKAEGRWKHQNLGG